MIFESLILPLIRSCRLCVSVHGRNTCTVNCMRRSCCRSPLRANDRVCATRASVRVKSSRNGHHRYEISLLRDLDDIQDGTFGNLERRNSSPQVCGSSFRNSIHDNYHFEKMYALLVIAKRNRETIFGNEIFRNLEDRRSSRSEIWKKRIERVKSRLKFPNFYRRILSIVSELTNRPVNE